jgi:hypothetical protein
MIHGDIIMKSVLTLLGALLATATVHAADHVATLDKGNTQLGGRFSWSQTDTDRNSSNYISTLLIAPSAECFIMDNFSLGGTLTYLSNKVSSSTSNDFLGIGPSATFYFGAHDDLAYYFHQVIIYTQQLATSNQGATYGTSDLGVRFFANSKVAFGIGVDYNYNIGIQGTSTFGQVNASLPAAAFDHSIGFVGSFVYFL